MNEVRQAAGLYMIYISLQLLLTIRILRIYFWVGQVYRLLAKYVSNIKLSVLSLCDWPSTKKFVVLFMAGKEPNFLGGESAALG